jgi:hypothetical protein
MPDIYRALPEGTLDQMACAAGTEKASCVRNGYIGHNYMPAYERHLKPRRQSLRSVLEIGVLHGQSLNLWLNYFPQARVVGMDIHPDKKNLTADRLTIEIVDQGKGDDLRGLKQRHPPFDLVIDDGSHRLPDVLTSLQHLYPHVTLGGLYVIEDMECARYPLEPFRSVAELEAILPVWGDSHCAHIARAILDQPGGFRLFEVSRSHQRGSGHAGGTCVIFVEKPELGFPTASS